MKKDMDMDLLAYYERLRDNGAVFFVDDQPILPKKALIRVVKEENIYMPDYITDETGKITEVRFDRINPV